MPGFAINVHYRSSKDVRILVLNCLSAFKVQQMARISSLWCSRPWVTGMRLLRFFFFWPFVSSNSRAPFKLRFYLAAFVRPIRLDAPPFSTYRARAQRHSSAQSLIKIQFGWDLIPSNPLQIQVKMNCLNTVDFHVRRATTAPRKKSHLFAPHSRQSTVVWHNWNKSRQQEKIIIIITIKTIKSNLKRRKQAMWETFRR